MGNRLVIYGGIGVLAMVAMLLSVGVAFAGNGNTNQAGAQKVSWQLSGTVMPVPPYGSGDIVGSNTASKLIVNRPNGNTKVTLTGVMGGLEPHTTYTVYLSNPYTPYVHTGWNLDGNWIVDFTCNTGCSGSYNHDMMLSQSGTSLSGSGGYPVGGPYAYSWTITSGSVSGNTVHIEADYVGGAACSMTIDGTIAPGGSMSGTWSDDCYGGRTGTWSTVSGTAVDHTGDTGWTGLLTSNIQPFTFTTGGSGSGSWHVNLKAGEFTGSEASVWINGGSGTILVSDNFQIG